jgi:hypothetical protein
VKAPPPRKVVKRQAVRVVRENAGAALVEWEVSDDLRRAWVPVLSIKDGTIDADVLVEGTPVGVDWAKFIKVQATPERLAKELRKAGIWTVEDLTHRAAYVKGVLLNTYMLDFAALVEAVKKEA